MQAFLTSDISLFPVIKRQGYFPVWWNDNEHPRAMAGVVASKMVEHGLSGCACAEADKDKAELVLKIVRTNYRLNVNQAFMMSNLWHNLKHLTAVPEPAFGVGFPCVIVASGPSLEDNLELLKSWQGQCLMVACGSSVIRLMDYGIKPDVVCHVDPFPKASAHFPEGDYTLLSSYTADRVGVANHKGKRLFARIKRDMGFGLELPGPIWETDVSVSTFAFQYALYAGCDPIIFVGQDCGWTGDVSHAKGTCFDASPNKENFEMMREYFLVTNPICQRRVIQTSATPLNCEHIEMSGLEGLKKPFVYNPPVRDVVGVDTSRVLNAVRSGIARHKLYAKSDYELFFAKQKAEEWWKYVGQTMNAHLYEAKVNGQWELAFTVYGEMLKLLEKLVIRHNA